MRRFEGRWEKWDQAVRSGEKPASFLPKLTDESVIELLAAGDVHARRYELNLLAVEMLNRLARFRRLLGEAVDASAHAINEAREHAETAAQAADATEDAVRRHMDLRRDFQDGEPEQALQARLAVQHAREALLRAVEVEERLCRLADEAYARSRESRQEDPAGDGR